MKHKKFDYKKFMQDNNLKPQYAYWVYVSYFGGNPMHTAILTVGFDSGAYWNLTDGDSIEAVTHKCHIEIIKEIGKLGEGKAIIKSRESDHE